MIVFLIALLTCVILFVAAFLPPQLSRKPQYRIDKLLAKAAGKASHAPGPLRKLIAQPFGKSEKVTNKSARAGRKTRFKLPF